MTKRFFARTLAWLLLVTGLSIGSNQKQSADDLESDEPIARTISGADCSFQQDPEKYLNGLRRTIEQLSARTERFVNNRPIIQYSRRHQSASGPKADNPTNQIPSRGYIDDYIFGKMRADSVPSAPLASDEEFLRRASLDLTGRTPTSFEVREFVQSTDPEKRRAFIRRAFSTPRVDEIRLDRIDSSTEIKWYEGSGEQRTSSRAFVDKWTMFFGDLLQNTQTSSNVTRYVEGRNAFFKSIREFVATGSGYDQYVKKLITATGESHTVGEVNWIVGGQTPMGPIQDTYDTLAAKASGHFLGLAQMDCLLCHAGAGKMDQLNVWGTQIKREQAWQLAASFSRTQMRRVSTKETPQVNYWTVQDTNTGGYRLNTTAGNRPPRQPNGNGEFVTPRYIFSNEQSTETNYRKAFAEQLVRDRQFARATVNYLWKAMMVLGLVEPADQFDLARLNAATTPQGWSVQPSHPELLEALTDDFIRSGYNFRYILSLIADSSTYQLSTSYPGEWKVEYTPYFARKYTRRLWGEEIHDAINQATGVIPSYPITGFDPFRWAMQLPEPVEPRSNRTSAVFMDYFLRGNRDDRLRADEASILQALNLMNNSFVLTRIKNNQNMKTTVYKLLSNNTLSDRDVIEELFLNTLGRFPTPPELSTAQNALKANRVTGAENLQWALLNKLDFLYNY